MRAHRQHLPHAVIVIGGHITGLSDLAERIDADHLVRGDGIAWFRRYLGEDDSAPVVHPKLWAGFTRRAMGVDLPFSTRTASAALVPSVGCPVGCDFCSTSAMFGGKGKLVSFFPEAKDLFAVMCELEDAMKMRSFFVMDENFLLQKKRSMELLELMRRHEKSWALYVFELRLRDPNVHDGGTGGPGRQLGLDGPGGQGQSVRQAQGHRLPLLVAEMQQHGIRVLGSSIIGLEEHTPENIDQAIAYAVSHKSDFHQFMLYTPVAGTPLYSQMEDAGRLLSTDEISYEDTHGQFRFNFRHANIPPGRETAMLLRAFNEDYRLNGPSAVRTCRTTLKGYRRHRHHPERRIRERYAWEAEDMATVWAGSVWAAKRYFADNAKVAAQLGQLLDDVKSEFGLKAHRTRPCSAGTCCGRSARRPPASPPAGPRTRRPSTNTTSSRPEPRPVV